MKIFKKQWYKIPIQTKYLTVWFKGYYTVFTLISCFGGSVGKLKRFWSDLHKVHPPTPLRYLALPSTCSPLTQSLSPYGWSLRICLTFQICDNIIDSDKCELQIITFFWMCKSHRLLLKDWQLRFTVKCD